MRSPVLIAAMLIAALPARATVTEFATRADFAHAAGRVTTERFEGCAKRTTVFTGPLASAPSTACPGGIAAGLTLANEAGPAGSALYISAPGYVPDRSHAVGSNGSAASAFDISFASGTRAAAFDLYQNFGGGAQLGRAAPFAVTLYAGTDVLGAFTVLVPSGRRAFFGALSDGATITRIAISNKQAFETIDNLSFAGSWPPLNASPDPTPEPGTAALFALAAFGVVAVRRR